MAACLVEYVNKVGGGQKKFKSLEEMKQHMAKEAECNKRTNAGESSEEDEDEICRCQKRVNLKLTREIFGIFVVQITLILVYFNTLTITLTNKSILPNWNSLFKPQHLLEALVMLSGSSLGALRELVAVAGIHG